MSEERKASIGVYQKEFDSSGVFRAEVEKLQAEGWTIVFLPDMPTLTVGLDIFEWCPGKETALRRRIKRLNDGL